MVVRAQTSTAASARGRRRRRSGLRFLLSIVIVLAIAWVGYWYVAYNFASRYISDASAADSGTLACGEVQLGGFPAQIALNCRDASVQSDNARVTVAGLEATAPLYDPGRVEANLDGPFGYSGVNHTIAADWAGANVVAKASLGGVNQAEITLADLGIHVTDAVDNAVWAATADAWATAIRGADGDDNAFHVTLSTSKLVVQLGEDTYPAVSGTATLTVLNSGNSIDRNPSLIAGDWLAAGGAFHIDDMVLTSGDVVAEFTGPMNLEIDGTLSGDVTLRYYGNDLPILIRAIFPWAADNADLIAEALQRLSRPIEMRGQEAYEVQHLILDHGGVKIGLIPIPLDIPSIGPLDFLLPPA